MQLARVNMELSNYSESMHRVFHFAVEEASFFGATTVRPIHLLLGLLRLFDDDSSSTLAFYGLTLPIAISKLQEILKVEYGETSSLKPTLGKSVESFLNRGLKQAEGTLYTTSDLLVRILDGSDKEITRLLFEVNIDPSLVSLDAGHKDKESEYRAQLTKQIELWDHRINLAKFAGKHELMQQAIDKKTYYQGLLKNQGQA